MPQRRVTAAAEGPATPRPTRGREASDRRTPTERRRRLLGTAAQAAAELAEIGVVVSARALRNAVARLPRP